MTTPTIAGPGPVGSALDVGGGPDEARPRFRRAGVDHDLALTVAGSALGALGFTWIGYERLLPVSGAMGFWLCWYAAFLGLVTGVTAMEHGRLDVTDRLVSVLCCTAGILVVGALVLVIGYTAFRGYRALHPNFFTETLAATGPLDPLRQGGALHAMVGTLEQVGLAVSFSVPLGLTTAVFLSEVRGPIARPVRTVVDAMSAIPSIVAGLFIYATVILSLGVGKSGIAASLALTVMMMPILTRAAEVVLRLVPNGLREASYALGSSQWRTVLHVVLPTARSGLVTAIILGVARGVGETAPVLLTAGVTQELNRNPLSGPQMSLPLYIYNLVRFPQPNMIARAYGAALVLLAIVMVLFVTARLVGGRPPGESSRRQRRRLART